MRRKFMLSMLAPAALILQLGTGWAVECGSAYFSDDINWPQNPTLYYSVAGSPASTCGDLVISRNGSSPQTTTDWICTDSSGNATKGSWSYYDQTDDETAVAYIDWGSCVSPTKTHIWDVGGATPTIETTAPGDFAGEAEDEPWGAGFDDNWTYCYGTYKNETTGKWWSYGTGYNNNSETFVTCSMSSVDGRFLDWYTTSTQRPASGDHTPGDDYVWTIHIWDGGRFGTDVEPFTY